ncbi:glycosyltransferase [Arthrobacter livingstonensis]|uniref:glycosyltransferase n=1 Tax=Arthrobacter livingstonensis TaxID=670078 RepID=UPI001476683B|nr:glycosyltransferase [Arthrobacter livingstonensis]
MTTHIGEIAVVVPARNEAQLLPNALTSLEAAMAHFAWKVSIPTSLTVVLDRTSDNSAQIVAHHPKVLLRHTSAGRVGAARNVGITAAMSLAKVPPAHLWIANTDADSMVPADWLWRHYGLAMAGAHVVAGTVEPVHVDLSSAALARWFACHDLSEGHPHIHGANLGFRAEVFTKLGGFSDQSLHEDRDFVAKARTQGYAVMATDSCRVTTSGRRHSRVDGGFADFLNQLDNGGERTDPSATSSHC